MEKPEIRRHFFFDRIGERNFLDRTAQGHFSSRLPEKMRDALGVLLFFYEEGDLVIFSRRILIHWLHANEFPGTSQSPLELGVPACRFHGLCLDILVCSRCIMNRYGLACRDEPADDDVLLKAAERIDTTLDRL